MVVLIANPALKLPVENQDEERYFFGAGCRFPWSLRKDKTSYPRYAMFPFFLGYTAAVLERDGFEVQVIDGVPLNLAHAEFMERAMAVQPDLVLFEPATPYINWVSQVARELIAKTSARIVFAGSHVTTFPREVLTEHPHVHAVMIGEYELAFLELARRMRDGQSFSGLRGVAYRNEAGAFCGGDRAPEIDPIDQLPQPARHLFPAYFNRDLGRYHDGFCQHRPAIQLHSSRGCPFRCNFCLWIQVMYNNGKHRCFSAPRRVAKAARRLGIKTHMTVTFGLSGETRESIERTFEFARNLDVDSVQFSVATPYPGTRFYHELKNAGLLKFEKWEDFDGANNALFDTEGLDPAFVERFEATAHGRWLRHKLRDPRWLLRQMRYLVRLGKGQGMSGIYKRLARAFRLMTQRSVKPPAAPALGASGMRLRVTGPRP